MGDPDNALVQFASGMPQREVTAADPDLIYMLGAFRRELNSFQQAVTSGTVTASERDGMLALLEDFARVIRVSLGTSRVGNVGWPAIVGEVTSADRRKGSGT